MSSKEKLSLRVEMLEQQLEKIKEENLGKIKNENTKRIENNIFFKSCKEIHKTYSKYYQIFKKMAFKFNPIIFDYIITGCFISILLVNE